MTQKVNIFWFRRDLRLHDNTGFQNALKGKYPVLPIFIFDTEIISELPKDDARITFIFQTLQSLRAELQKHGSSLAIYHGNTKDVFQGIISKFGVQNVITNHDYEPYARDRDQHIEKFLSHNKIKFHTFKDQVLFEKNEIVKGDGTPYLVYTPYMKKWKAQYNTEFEGEILNSKKHFKNLYQNSRLPNLSLNDIGFEKSTIKVPDYSITPLTIQQYENKRDFPAEDATSHLGIYLRFGTVSIREIMKKATAEKNEVFWQELIWREFFMQILWHFPETVENAFKKKYDRIKWRNNEVEFQRWKEGKTGYPLVDAGMRQLNTTGYMHNRVRMVVASFLCKHLLIDWRWGEAYFAEKLLDYELSSNVGNWQWAAGCGVDAAPYFRIFNPTTQIEKYDKDYKYIKKYVSEFETAKYPEKIVDHKVARERCLKVYKAAIS
ncbi:cryptochrome/photolyase family protein [Aequorivita xiaoshiensis]|uniref:DNA photolyase family protein n=1 Tax=Aequorivita xiaoshiensis TaxID=2874476 RepID=A0A9X1R319_9FLAO|nr:deoxyribodipyrimidine photo-lyase [Aequorivita xiaoshiensis]MCG2431366.1 DNA photolyase family protein [Aequorivita xiaoshiensis]